MSQAITTRNISLCSWQAAAVFNPFNHLAMFGGVATGKTYTGSHFVIEMISKYPALTGLIGANTYDQLSQATLAELFLWLDTYGFEYVIDKRPPDDWGPRKKLKKYNNVLSIRNQGRVTTIFTRVMSDGNPLRGLSISWYWLDETRDTPHDTHNVVLARMRESEVMKGLITTTTNGEDWCHDRFYAKSDGKVFNSIHVPTIESVKVGIITKEFYDSLANSFDENTRAQELEAKHVNTAGKPAYKSFGKHNEALTSPFCKNDELVTPYLPVIIGLDFNVNPMAWHLGQIRGNTSYWFDEIYIENTNTPEASLELRARLLELKKAGLLKASPNVKLCGDATGESRNTKATESDYDIICAMLDEIEVTWTNDTPKSNPPVKERVNTVNVRCKSADGSVTFFFHPIKCPKLKRDGEKVVWKEGAGSILDQTTDPSLTHCMDSVGYPLSVYCPIELYGSVGKLHVIPR